jgi:hypothetical protein
MIFEIWENFNPLIKCVKMKSLSICHIVICKWVLSLWIMIFVNDGLKVGGWKSGSSKVNGLIKKEKMDKDENK